MVLVNDDVVSDVVVDSYMMCINCMLKEIELMIFSGVHLYRLYRYVVLYNARVVSNLLLASSFFSKSLQVKLNCEHVSN